MPSNRISPRDYRIFGIYLTYANRIAKRYIIAVAALARCQDRRRRAAARRLTLLGEPRSERAGTRIFIAELLAPQCERLSVLFDQTLDVIEDAFQARKIFLREACSWAAGRIHYVLVEAGKMSFRLLSPCK